MTPWREVSAGGELVRSRWIFNCYILGPESKAPLVVDVGLPDHGRAAAVWWVDARGPDEPVSVFATHGHSDHVCGIPELTTHRRASVSMSSVAERFLDGEVPRGPGPRAVARIGPVFRSQRWDAGALVDSATAPRVGYGISPSFAWPLDRPRFLDDGDRLGAEGEWEVLSTPGHVDDSLSLYNASTRTLCAGDAVLSAYGRAWITPEVCDPDAAARTEDRLRGLRVDVLLPGHGPPVVGTDLMAGAASRLDAQGWIPSCRRWLRRRVGTPER